MKYFAAIVLSLFAATSFAKEEVKAVAPGAKANTEVKKPCKDGQTADKDGCHEVKKAEKKPAAKKEEVKKDEKKEATKK